MLSNDDVGSTSWTRLTPNSPNYYFAPFERGLEKEYQDAFSLQLAMPESSIGIVTARDSLTIQFTPSEVWKTVKDFASLPVEEARSKYELGKDARDWTVKGAKADLDVLPLD